MTNLFESIGGFSAVDTVVETFYRKVLVDDRIKQFFDDIDMDEQIKKQKSFLTMAFGGPSNYSGKDMREAHKHLVEKGLKDEHVDAVIDLLGQSLSEHHVDPTHIEEIAGIANSVRKDVLNK